MAKNNSYIKYVGNLLLSLSLPLLAAGCLYRNRIQDIYESQPSQKQSILRVEFVDTNGDNLFDTLVSGAGTVKLDEPADRNFVEWYCNKYLRDESVRKKPDLIQELIKDGVILELFSQGETEPTCRIGEYDINPP